MKKNKITIFGEDSISHVEKRDCFHMQLLEIVIKQFLLSYLNLKNI